MKLPKARPGHAAKTSESGKEVKTRAPAAAMEGRLGLLSVPPSHQALPTQLDQSHLHSNQNSLLMKRKKLKKVFLFILTCNSMKRNPRSILSPKCRRPPTRLESRKTMLTQLFMQDVRVRVYREIGGAWGMLECCPSGEACTNVQASHIGDSTPRQLAPQSGESSEDTPDDVNDDED